MIENNHIEHQVIVPGVHLGGFRGQGLVLLDQRP